MSETKVKVLCCKDCDEEFPRSDLSRRGLCAGCGIARMREASRQIREREGPIFQRYARAVRSARSMKGVVRGG